MVAPDLLDQYGVGPAVAAQLLITAGDNPERIRSERAFAMLCGVAPIPASSRRTDRHRLNRGGDRQANTALHTVVVCRWGKGPTHPRLRATPPRPRPRQRRDHAMFEAVPRPRALHPHPSRALGQTDAQPPPPPLLTNRSLASGHPKASTDR
ncbi:MAG TPA: transposase [Pilimelia sp.]|nr:transposase [Pilimelia sp.]